MEKSQLVMGVIILIETFISLFVLGNLFTLLSTWKSFKNIRTTCQGGGVAQMVERSLSMREVPGSIPGASRTFLLYFQTFCAKIKLASSGNRTRAARVAGEHSTTEPTMLDE